MILLRGITLTADDDFAPLLKKRPRTKKPREKLSFMWQIPISILRIREQTRSNGRIKNGKRYGFDLYNQLVCKVCKLNFHKRIGLDVHNEDIHKQRSNKEIILLGRLTQMFLLNKQGRHLINYQ